MRKYLLMVAAAGLLTACGGGSKGTDSKDSSAASSIQVDGSSTVFPITEIIAEEFEAANQGLSVVVGESGTGGGFKKFVRSEIDVADASRPISAKEDSLCKAAGIEYVEIPVAFDGLAVVVNPANTWASDITVKELQMLWAPEAQGKITKWNQIRKEWPNEKINLYGAGTASGTFDYFTEAIVGKAKSCRGDYNPSEDDNVLVKGVATDKFALGFFGYHYYKANKETLKALAIDDQNDANGKGAILPSEATILDATYQPLARPLFIYVSKKSMQRPEVKNFASFFVANATKFVPETGYIPLPPALYAKASARIEQQITGSPFLTLSSSVGAKLDEVYK
ncbi:MAG: PstS family phosphate ABC transporter substrate-binding protein [Cytophagaceae bacterium]|jgi:phosphate transport system substrate-binding protein|nr:PstS family phosphate ABC transporter substrate-binding protein [Cytophagaceae bacterium]